MWRAQEEPLENFTSDIQVRSLLTLHFDTVLRCIVMNLILTEYSIAIYFNYHQFLVFSIISDPTASPTAVPTFNPSQVPTANPTRDPTAVPTAAPTR